MQPERRRVLERLEAAGIRRGSHERGRRRTAGSPSEVSDPGVCKNSGAVVILAARAYSRFSGGLQASCEPVKDEAVAEAAVADQEVVNIKITQDGQDDGGAGEDDVGPFGMEADNSPTLGQ